MPPEPVTASAPAGATPILRASAMPASRVDDRRGLGLAATGLAAVAGPRSKQLTDALVRPAADGGLVSLGELRAVGKVLDRGIGRALERSSPWLGASCLRIGHYEVASALARRGWAGDPTPFRWSAASARRAVGLASVRACFEHHAPTPADAVALVLSDPFGAHGVKGAGTLSCADWLTCLPRPARAVVQAEATTWATRLWSALEWERLDAGAQVGPPDRWWRHGSCRLALRSRCDVHVPTADGPVLLTVLGGTPAPEDRVALCVAALVEGLARPSRVPARVGGWWPDCGKAWLVRVDARALDAAARAVTRAFECMVDGRRGRGSSTG